MTDVSCSSDIPKKCEATDEEGNSSDDQEHDEYSYTRLDDFTSEIYKIEIGNLPHYVGYKQLRKLLKMKLKLKCHKIKAIGSPPQFAFVTFRNEDDREVALDVLKGYKWKGKTLFVKKANPMADPLVKKRKAGDSEDAIASKKAKEDGAVDDIPISEKLKNSVTPLWKLPYPEQLKKKESEIQTFLIRLNRELDKLQNKLPKYMFKRNRKKYDHPCCQMEPIKSSPVTHSYRNKCEFTVGKDLYTKERNVGFRISRYKEGSMSVAEPDDCINIPKVMLLAVKSFQAYVRESDKDAFNPETHEGYWKQLTVRTSRNNDILLIVVMHPQSLSKEEIDSEIQKLKEYFDSGPGASFGVTSVYFHPLSKRQFGRENDDQLIHILGKTYLEESLLGMTFQIGPSAFFQINTAAAEILYLTISEIIGNDTKCTLFDICCGTGSIGLCLSKYVSDVIGIEMCAEAVENAKKNAEINGVTNVKFLCGKAEDILFSVIQKVESENAIAVLNPPRAGIHQKVLKAIRGCLKVKKLIYISCNPNAAFANFLDLCRPTSNNYRGSPFKPVQAIPVDMFPQTHHYELIIVFER